MTDEAIPLVDLAAQHAEVADEVDAAFREIFRSTAFINGPAVDAFEAAYAEFVGVRHCIGVSNGTDALELALRSCGVESGDEVLVPANSFVATAESVARIGAIPVFADVDSTSLLIDPQEVEKRLSPRTQAVAPVHLYGQMAPMHALADVLRRRDDVVVVEDAAQAHGARQAGRPAGGIGRAAGTSFYPGKNLGAYGDAGAVLTNDDASARLVRMMRDHGSETKYRHEVRGWNCRLDTLQAAVLLAKLRRLRDWNEARAAAARRYDTLLGGVDGVTRPETVPGNEHVWHLYVVQVSERDRVLSALTREGIGVGVHYPEPIHLQPAFADLGQGPGSFPVAERAAQHVLSLPMHPHLTEQHQKRVVDVLVAAVAEAA
jgi:dTDP-4-amino-4,6-dideoxygalactose transaminase